MNQKELVEIAKKIMVRYGANPEKLRVSVALYDDSLREKRENVHIEITRGDYDDYSVEIGYFKDTPLDKFENTFDKTLSIALQKLKIDYKIISRLKIW